MYTYAAPSLPKDCRRTGERPPAANISIASTKSPKLAKVYGVIADPIRHSISPAVHNRAFQARRLDSVYLPFLVTPLHLRDFFLLAGKVPISGFSVTIPHKQKVIRYLDAVDPLARRIGAVNTVWRKAGKWRGSQHGCRSGPRASEPARPARQSLRAHRRQWRRSTGRGLRSDRCRRQSGDRGPQPGPRPRALPDLRRRTDAPRTTGASGTSTRSSTPLRSACFPT